MKVSSSDRPAYQEAINQIWDVKDRDLRGEWKGVIASLALQYSEVKKEQIRQETASAAQSRSPEKGVKEPSLPAEIPEKATVEVSTNEQQAAVAQAAAPIASPAPDADTGSRTAETFAHRSPIPDDSNAPDHPCQIETDQLAASETEDLENTSQPEHGDHQGPFRSASDDLVAEHFADLIVPNHDLDNQVPQPQGLSEKEGGSSSQPSPSRESSEQSDAETEARSDADEGSGLESRSAISTPGSQLLQGGEGVQQLEDDGLDGADSDFVDADDTPAVVEDRRESSPALSDIDNDQPASSQSVLTLGGITPAHMVLPQFASPAPHVRLPGRLVTPTGSTSHETVADRPQVPPPSSPLTTISTQTHGSERSASSAGKKSIFSLHPNSQSRRHTASAPISEGPSAERESRPGSATEPAVPTAKSPPKRPYSLPGRARDAPPAHTGSAPPWLARSSPAASGSPHGRIIPRSGSPINLVSDDEEGRIETPPDSQKENFKPRSPPTTVPRAVLQSSANTIPRAEDISHSSPTERPVRQGTISTSIRSTVPVTVESDADDDPEHRTNAGPSRFAIRAPDHGTGGQAEFTRSTWGNERRRRGAGRQIIVQHTHDWPPHSDKVTEIPSDHDDDDDNKILRRTAPPARPTAGALKQSTIRPVTYGHGRSHQHGNTPRKQAVEPLQADSSSSSSIDPPSETKSSARQRAAMEGTSGRPIDIGDDDDQDHIRHEDPGNVKKRRRVGGR